MKCEITAELLKKAWAPGFRMAQGNGGFFAGSESLAAVLQIDPRELKPADMIHAIKIGLDAGIIIIPEDKLGYTVDYPVV